MTTDPYRHDEHILQRRTTDGGWRQIGVMADEDLASYVAAVLNTVECAYHREQQSQLPPVAGGEDQP